VRISHTELEVCRANPKQWAASRLQAGKSVFSYGYNQALKSAIYTFHDSNDPREGTKYLFEKLIRFRNSTRKAECESALKSYLKWAQSSGIIVAHWRVRLNLLLEWDVVLGGEISRVDVVPESDTYQAIILGDRPRDWKDELRFPLIQHEMAAQYHRPVNQMRVGYQNVDGSELLTVQYRKKEIEDALEEATEIAKIVEKEIAK